jgi:hypothetical protein
MPSVALCMEWPPGAVAVASRAVGYISVFHGAKMIVMAHETRSQMQAVAALHLNWQSPAASASTKRVQCVIC